MSEYDPTAVLEVGALRVRFAPVEHFVPAWAVEVAAPDGARLVFSADTGPCDVLVELARDAGLLLCEATLVEPAFGHLTAAQAGEHAARAGVGRLVLTHVSDELDGERHVAAAIAAFGGPVELASAGAAYDVPVMSRGHAVT